MRRIETLETELRRVCAAFNSPWCSLAEAPAAERRDDMTVRCDDLIEAIEYWRGVIADAEADGFKVWGPGPDDFTKGDFALYSGSWYQVGRKPGKKSVSVAWNLRLSPKMIMTLEDATGDDGKARTHPAHYSNITARLSAQDMAGFMERGRVPSEAEAHALAAGERWQPKATAAAVEPRKGGTTDVADRLRAMLAEGEQITKFPDRESDVTLACGRRYRVRMVRDKHGRETRFDGPPPPARRAPPRGPRTVPSNRPTSACAESTTPRPRSASPRTAHLRLRGEHRREDPAPCRATGPPPPARRARTRSLR